MTELPLTDPTAVDRLGADLRAADFSAEGVPSHLGRSAHHALGRGEWAPALRATRDGSPLATLVRLFLLGTAEPAAAVARALPGLGVADGIAAGVLEAHGDRIRAALDVRPHADDESEFLVISDLDSDTRPGPVRRDHVLGIGAASITLANAVIREPVGSVLDLGTGCGIQALHCYSHAESVVATDTNPRALALAAATARLNGQHWDLRQGSLFEPVAGERFDLIVSNPPFVIGGGDQRYLYRDSGIAGDGICRALVGGMADRLTEGGTAQLLANWMITDRQDWRSRVGEWLAPGGLDAWVVQREVADPAEYVALWLKDAGEQEAFTVADAWLDYFEAERVTGIGMGLITLRRSGSDRPDVVLDEIGGAGEEVTGPEAAAFLARRRWVRDTGDAELLATRLSLADTVYLEHRAIPSAEKGWLPVLRMLRRPGGPGATLQVDEWGQSLLAGCTGQAPLSLLLDLLAQANGFDVQALTDAVLPSIRDGITRGLLHPVGG